MNDYNARTESHYTKEPMPTKDTSTIRLHNHEKMRVYREEERGGGWELSGDYFKVNDYNARTESCCTKESTPTKDTSTSKNSL